MSRYLMGLLGYRGTRQLSDEQRKKQSELAKRIIACVKPGNYGRIGKLEDKIHSALFASAGLPVTTRDLALWCYFGARWWSHLRKAKEPFPDERHSLPTYPPTLVYPLDQWGLEDKSQTPFKPNITRSMLVSVLKSVRTFGKRVKGPKGSAAYWLLNPEIQFYSEAREIKTKRNAARRALKDKAKKRQTKRYGKA